MINCPKCGFHINSGEVFCRMCGTKLSVMTNNSQNNVEYNPNKNDNQQQVDLNGGGFYKSEVGYGGVNENNYQNFNSSFQNFDDDLINAYIGKNVDKIKNGTFSPNTFFFGCLYVLYRKMWLFGFIWLIGCILVFLFFNSFKLIIFLILNSIMAFIFKGVYLNYVKKQVENIKLKNDLKSREKLMLICSQKGGTSLIPIFLIILFYIVLVFSLKTFITNYAAKSSKHIQDKFDDIISDSVPTSTIGNLKFEMPSILHESDQSSGTNSKFYYSEDSDGYYCSLIVYYLPAATFNNDAKKGLEDLIYSSHRIKSNVIQKKINNTVWYQADVAENNFYYYYYVTINNEKLYRVQFYIVNDKDNICFNAYNTVIESMEFN